MTLAAPKSTDLLTTEQAAILLGIKTNTLEIWRTKGKGPAFVKLGNAKQAPVRYLKSTIVDWITAQSFPSTSAYSTLQNTRHASPSHGVQQ